MAFRRQPPRPDHDSDATPAAWIRRSTRRTGPGLHWTTARATTRRQVSWLAGRRSASAFPKEYPSVAADPSDRRAGFAHRLQLQGQPRHWGEPRTAFPFQAPRGTGVLRFRPSPKSRRPLSGDAGRDKHPASRPSGNRCHSPGAVGEIPAFAPQSDVVPYDGCNFHPTERIDCRCRNPRNPALFPNPRFSAEKTGRRIGGVALGQRQSVSYDTTGKIDPILIPVT